MIISFRFLDYRLVQERFALRRDADPGQLLALLTWLSWSKAWRGQGNPLGQDRNYAVCIYIYTWTFQTVPKFLKGVNLPSLRV